MQQNTAKKPLLNKEQILLRSKKLKIISVRVPLEAHDAWLKLTDEEKPVVLNAARLAMFKELSKLGLI